jgi:hypothetical protein
MGRFSEVTGTACQSTIVLGIGAFAGDRNDVFDFKWKVEYLFRGMAIFTTMSRPQRYSDIIRVH